MIEEFVFLLSVLSTQLLQYQSAITLGVDVTIIKMDNSLGQSTRDTQACRSTTRLGLCNIYIVQDGLNSNVRERKINRYTYINRCDSAPNQFNATAFSKGITAYFV